LNLPVGGFRDEDASNASYPTIRSWRWVISLLRRGRREREMEDEMSFHLEMQIEQNLESGIADDEAHYAARRQFGNQT
jgi:hypothetical protein